MSVVGLRFRMVTAVLALAVICAAFLIGIWSLLYYGFALFGYTSPSPGT